MKIGKTNNKYFYMALVIGAFAVFTITYTATNIRNVSEKLVSINEAKNSIEESDDMKISNEISSNYVINKDGKTKENKSNNNDNKVLEEKKAITTSKKLVKKEEKKIGFSEDKGLSWPVDGKVLKKYSMDSLVYFPTLGVFKSNPGIFIEAVKGKEVKAAYAGKVTSIGENKELGKYIELDIGNGYKLLYGQVYNINVKPGNKVKENDIIAKVADVSSYYTKEGNHLYFRVTQNQESIDPMLLLK